MHYPTRRLTGMTTIWKLKTCQHRLGVDGRCAKCGKVYDWKQKHWVAVGERKR